jgi:outer membrane protein OmpA-like peptidoglycan-associated protein
MLIGRNLYKQIAAIGLFAFGVGACASETSPNPQLVIESNTRSEADISRYTRLHEENPEDLQILIQLSRHLRHAGRGEDAVNVLVRAEDSFGAHTDYLTELGNAHLVAGEPLAARQVLRAAIEQDADNWRALAALGVANDLERRYAEARQAYVSALNSCPNSAAILNNLALSESYTGNFVSSMSRLNRAMQVQPGSLRIRRNWVVLSTLKARCADCDGDEYAQLARSIHPQDWRNANSEITCGNYVTRADLIATKLQENDFIDMRVHFEFDSDTLTPEAHEALDELAEAINSNALADYRFRLEGHTDALGSDEYNQDLSDRRAASVSNYLTNVHGIDTGRLESIGFGESQLAAQDDPTSGLNRRVRVVKLGRITDFPIAGL